MEVSGFRPECQLLLPMCGVHKPGFTATSAALWVAAAVIPPVEISQPGVQVEWNECSCELWPITCPDFSSGFFNYSPFPPILN